MLPWNKSGRGTSGIMITMFAEILFSMSLRIEESLRVQDNDKPKGNNVVGPSVVNMMQHTNSFRYNENKGKRKHQDTKADLNKKSKDDDVAWWVDSGAVTPPFLHIAVEANLGYYFIVQQS
ncbi:hypothetical protein Tco_0531008 [Tanacetum coccineum]